jgi:hypothetical protein
VYSAAHLILNTQHCSPVFSLTFASTIRAFTEPVRLLYTVVTGEVSTGDKGGVQRHSKEDIEAPDLSGDMHRRITREKPLDPTSSYG